MSISKIETYLTQGQNLGKFGVIIPEAKLVVPSALVPALLAQDTWLAEVQASDSSVSFNGLEISFSYVPKGGTSGGYQLELGRSCGRI